LSIESPVRASEPRISTLLPPSSVPWLDSARLVLSEAPDSSCALIMKTTSENSSQMPIAAAIQVTMRPGESGLRSRGPRSRRLRKGRFSEPSPLGLRMPDSGLRRER
jgi:hypothetical protein